MNSDHSDGTTDMESLPPKVLTERLNGLEPGDEVNVNNHERAYKVVDTDTYSVIAESPDGHRVTFSQNLQTGGWTFTEEVAYVKKTG